jgi:transmembrane sensor
MNDLIKNILQKGKAKSAGLKERQEMLALFHLPEKEYEIKDELVKELEEWNENEESLTNKKQLFARVWEVIEKQKKQNNKITHYLNLMVKIAAVLLIGFSLGIFFTSLLNKQEPVYYTAHSPLGSVSNWTLPDGTVIFLNSGSEIKYRINGKNAPREVFLSGEAWFKVEKNKNKAFVVHTSLYNVKVTGTRFNVKAYEEEGKVTTTLEEGQVIILSGNGQLPEEGVVLHPGQQLVLVDNYKMPEIKQVNPKWYTAWKDNKLILVNMPLKELVVLLERKYGVEFVVKDEDILNYHCDATFHGETLFEFLDILKKMIPIDYKIVGQTIEITADKIHKKGGIMNKRQ